MGIQENDTEMLRHSALVSVWVRWGVLAVLFSYFASGIVALGWTHFVIGFTYGLALLFTNAGLHYLLVTHRAAPSLLFHALGMMDVFLITVAIWMTGGLDSPLYALYFPVLAVLALGHPSIRFNLALVTLASGAYATTSVLAGSGSGITGETLAVLGIRIAMLYTVALAVTLVVAFERARRAEALARQRELEREQVALSQSLHDTAAQTAYMIGLGIEGALAAADRANAEQVAQLEATHALSKSAMWDLRHPIDMGLIFEGRDLGGVLRSHAVTFSTITSVHTEVMESGMEPNLPAVIRGLLFSIAHNAMTNAYRHARASSVTIELDFGEDNLRMAISDDGWGLPANVGTNGHGFRNMGDYAQRLGGSLEVSCGRGAAGTTVTCLVPYECNQRRVTL